MPASESTLELFREAGVLVLSDVIRSLSDLPVLPVDQVTLPETSDFLDNIGLVRFETVEQADFDTARAVLLLATELKLDIPGLEGFALVLGSTADGGSEITLEFDLGPDYFEFRIVGNVAFRFARDILKPVVQGLNGWEEVPDKYTEIRIDGTLHVDGDGDVSVDGPGAFDLPPSMIGETGVIIEAKDIALILSRKTALPPAAPVEIVPGWRGVFIGRAAVYLPESINVPIENLAFENCYIGSGGFTGEALTSWTIDPPSGDVFGATFSLTRVHLGFRQNTLTQSAIAGNIKLPFFDEAVDVEIAINVNGNLSVSLASETGRYLTKPGILKLKVASLAFVKHGDDFLIKISGSIKLLYGGFPWPEVDVQELSIDKDGHIHIYGGWLELPKKAAFDFDGFAMELTKIGFGNANDGQKWVGFSGSIMLVEELAFGASVDGLKVLWDESGPRGIELSKIEVALAIPDTLFVDGAVEYFHDATSKGFRGDVTLALAAPKIAFDAHMMVGRNTQNPAYNFFKVVVDVELPAGIPLGQTNAAIYGFTGMLGNNVAPNKAPGIEWYQWYGAPPVGTLDDSKWAGSRGSLALGAGVTLGTAADNGFGFSAKTVLIVLMPGPLLLLDGKANMLTDRTALTTGPGDYRALAVLDGRAGTLLIDIQPQFKYDPMTGSMAQITGLAEVFFDFHHHDAWHVYLGQEPPAKRIRGLLYQLIKADAYLMLDHQGMRLGASAGIDKRYDFGALKVALKAVIEGDAAVSWRPTQLDGKLTIDGLADLRAFGCSTSASVNASLAVETPRPLTVEGDVKVKLKTPWPLPDPSAHIHFKWSGDQSSAPPPPTVADVAAEHLKVTKSWRLSGDPAVLQPVLETAASVVPHLLAAAVPVVPHLTLPGHVPASAPVLPLDAKLLVSFNRPVADRALVGSNGAPAPRPERSGAFDIAHELLAIKLAKGSADGSTWTPVTSRDEGTGDLFGMWLPLPEGDRAAGKLQLWSRSPFTYSRNGGRSYVDWFTDQNPKYPCVPDEPPESLCSDFDALRLPTVPTLFVAGDVVFEFAFSDPSMRPQLVAHPSTLTGTKRALQVSYLGAISLRMTPIEPSATVTVFASHASAHVTLTLRAFRDGQPVATATSQSTGDIALTVTAKGIEYVELAAKGSRDPQPVLVLRVCVTPQAQQDRADQIVNIQAHLQAQLAPGASWCGEDHLLDADSTYQLTVRTQIRKWRDGQELPAEPPHEELTYFRTQGPPGSFETQGPIGFETQGPLRDLSSYVSFRSSVPGNGARPVYRGYDFRVVFDANYMERLYKGTGHDLSIALVDQNGQLARSITGAPVPVATEWDRDPYGAAVEEQQWVWAISRSAGCAASAGPDCLAKRSSLEARLRELPLPPQALIEARIAAAGRPPLHRSSFTTSRFVTFIHHVQSFAGETNDYRLGAAEAPSSLAPDASNRLREIVQTRRQSGPAFDAVSEPLAFDELNASVFDLGLRPGPDRIELTLLRDDARRYALLLESPEPFDWARTSLTVRHATTTPSVGMQASGSARIIDAALQPAATAGTADYNTEWIELLIATDANVSRYSVEHTGSLQEVTAFTSYYRFGDEASVPAGTLIRVHSGRQAADTAPVPERLHRYVTAPGGNESWRLNPAGDVVRLLDASGGEVERWSILPGSAFVESDIVMIRNADQTRAFLFFPESAEVVLGDVPEGLVRLEWTFTRDVGEQAPVLRRWGLSGSEHTSTEFHVPPAS